MWWANSRNWIRWDWCRVKTSCKSATSAWTSSPKTWVHQSLTIALTCATWSPPKTTKLRTLSCFTFRRRCLSTPWMWLSKTMTTPSGTGASSWRWCFRICTREIISAKKTSPKTSWWGCRAAFGCGVNWSWVWSRLLKTSWNWVSRTRWGTKEGLRCD